MTLEVAVGVAIALVAGAARWHTWRSRRTPLGRANLALARAQRRRLTPPDPEQQLSAGEWVVLVVVGLLWLAWGAAPIVAEFVGAARGR
jgi:hypothetical protein